MKLYYMKQSALDYMKSNMDQLYYNYFRYDSPAWIDELFDYSAFEEFKEIESFELCSLQKSPGEIDLENCKILYEKLGFISESMASDERLWAGLCNKTFYEYLRERLKLASSHMKSSSDDSSFIKSRYFFKTRGRSGMFRNVLARCWWTGKLTYSEKYKNKWELLDAIGPEDLISKMSDIFYSNNYSSNIAVVEGFCEGLKFFRDRGIKVSNREHIRPTAQYLNAIGGGALLDMFSADEIKKLVIERIGMLNKGADIGTLIQDDSDTLEDDDIDGTAEAVNVNIEEFEDSLEPVTDIDLDSVLGELESVEYGCTVFILKRSNNKTFITKMGLADETPTTIQILLLGRQVGYEYCIMDEHYQIAKITRN